MKKSGDAAVPGPFAGRTAVVTGAGRGIGRATALALAGGGARVVLVGRRAELLEETCALAGGGVALAADVTDAAWLARLDEAAPAVDVLVNNASSYVPYRAAERVGDEDLRAAFDTIVGGSLRLARHVLPGMRERGFGRIVNVGSLAARLGGAGQLAYATAKAALAGMTRAIAVEASHRGVTCNLVEPGLIDTERTREALDPETRLAILAGTAARRAGTPEEVAAVIAFLASPAASYVTGASIPVSGGLELGIAPARE